MIILILHMYINIKAFSLYDIYKFTWHEKSTVCSTLAVNINTKLRAAFRHAILQLICCCCPICYFVLEAAAFWHN